ncbi:MAG: CBS domain-containing protein [Deltaproteobacteria bacterium]|jgi:CBS domain-containing protein/gamma-glutamyl:cysteine ligase YbdK (ATP-grasp superfamily)|nr:CBS domain-containing protein [Deltaproteobacteria bacterium]MBW2537531.1 CBS domain-containing protein [Deltaproteobacteria bacterium]
MGTSDVATGPNASEMRAFTRAVLDDVIALEKLIEEGRVESGVRRIGAEQEMFLIDSSRQPAPVAVEVLEELRDEPRVTTELARFNLEVNLTPQTFGPDCLRNMEWELGEVLERIDRAAQKHGASVLLAGILPTLRVTNLSLDMMTPNPRYYELNRATSALRDGAFHIVMKGLDELDITHDNVMFESANTSFQIHFQVGPEEFAPLYNLAQAISAPVLAAAVNSPILFGQRLWYETRVALFQRSVDVRSSAHRRRASPPRVSFGEEWIRESILEIYHDDISRFRMLLSMPPPTADPAAVVADGGVPELRALRLHTGTVWRWNRACYGVNDGVPHLRIENRVLPAGPTVLDEVANAAFFYGLMSQLSVEYPRIDEVLDFDDAKNNFFAAARHGLKAQFNWLEGRVFTARDLIVNELLPHARQGLQRQGIREEDIARYLDTIEERVESEQTGSVWVLRSLAEMEGAPADVRLRSLTAAMHRNQKKMEPIHKWPLAELYRTQDWFPSYRTVGQFMSTELFTVRPQDPVDLAAKMMEWHHIRYVPVEDDHGRLAGLISYRSMLKLVDMRKQHDSAPVVVEDIMHRSPVTVDMDTPTLEAMGLMRHEKVGCLCVIDDEGRLAGLVHIYDLLKVAQRVLEDFLREETTDESSPSR